MQIESGKVAENASLAEKKSSVNAIHDDLYLPVVTITTPSNTVESAGIRSHGIVCSWIKIRYFDINRNIYRLKFNNSHA
jgi:hypothetical protein